MTETTDDQVDPDDRIPVEEVVIMRDKYLRGQQYEYEGCLPCYKPEIWRRRQNKPPPPPPPDTGCDWWSSWFLTDDREQKVAKNESVQMT